MTDKDAKPHDNLAPRCDDIAWKCNRCRALLGYIDRATRMALRIKIKDSFWWIEDAGRVCTACRTCGAYNEILRKQ